VSQAAAIRYNNRYNGAMVTVKVTAIGNSLGVILPREVLAQLGVEKGDQLHVIATPGGVELSAFDPQFAQQMGVLDQVVRAERDVLRYVGSPQLKQMTAAGKAVPAAPSTPTPLPGKTPGEPHHE
jgi:putative addiction module antidote